MIDARTSGLLTFKNMADRRALCSVAYHDKEEEQRAGHSQNGHKRDTERPHWDRMKAVLKLRRDSEAAEIILGTLVY